MKNPTRKSTKGPIDLDEQNSKRIPCSFSLPQKVRERINERRRHWQLQKPAHVVVKIVEEYEAHILAPTAGNEINERFGLAEILHYSPEAELKLLAEVSTAEEFTFAGEDFSWFYRKLDFMTMIQDRLTRRKPTKFLIPHPVKFPDPDRDITLGNVVRTIFHNRWSEVKQSSPEGVILVRGVGVSRQLPYFAILTERVLWVKHNLGASPKHPLFWIYANRPNHENMCRQWEADFKALEEVSRLVGDWDLVERYRPRT